MSHLDSRLSDIDNRLLELEAEKLILVEKAMKSSDPASLVRASMELSKLHVEPNSKSYIYEHIGMAGQNFEDKVSELSYDMLRQMAKTPIIRGIIGTRQAQILNFSTVSSDDQSVGWAIRKKRKMFRVDTDKDLTYEDKARIEYITEFIERCGRDDSEFRYTGDNFQTFLQKLVKDSLELDQSTFELISDRRGRLSNFIATDGATFRRARQPNDDTPEDQKPIEVNGMYPHFVQLYEGRVFSEFYPWELSFGVRNQSSDVTMNGYGVSELEDLFRIVTWMLNGDMYNGKFFSQGSSPKGILAISGSVSQPALQAFKNNWQSMVAGVQNAWKTPVLESDKVSWIDLQKTNQDMQFAQWGEYLVRTTCAVYKIDPMEVGLVVTGSSGGGTAQYSSVNQKINYSKDKGLYPLLQHIQEKINLFIVRRLDPGFEFVWTGLNPQDESAILDMDIKKLSNYETVNEIRIRRGLAPIKGGDIILNTIMAQARQAELQGSPDSNAAVDGMQDEFDGQEDGADEGSIDLTFDKGNPMAKDLKEWISSGMPNTMDLSSLYMKNLR